MFVIFRKLAQYILTEPQKLILSRALEYFFVGLRHWMQIGQLTSQCCVAIVFICVHIHMHGVLG